MYISKMCKFNICEEALLLVIRNFTLNNNGSYSRKNTKIFINKCVIETVVETRTKEHSTFTLVKKIL